jgi:hypothetical protein
MGEGLFLPGEELVTYDQIVEECGGKEHPPSVVEMVPGFGEGEYSIDDLMGRQIYVQVPRVPMGIPTKIRDVLAPEKPKRPADGSYDLFALTGETTVEGVAKWLIEHPDNVPGHVANWLAVFEGPLREEEEGGPAPLIIVDSVTIRGKDRMDLAAGSIPLGSPDVIALAIQNLRGEPVGQIIGYSGKPGKLRLVARTAMIVAIIAPTLIKKGNRERFIALMRARGWLSPKEE